MTGENNNKRNQENISFYNQVDSKATEAVKNTTQSGGTIEKKEPADEVTSNQEEVDRSVDSKKFINKAEEEVRENEDASLQDDSYSFDEANTSNEEYHDVDDDFKFDNSDIDFDNDEDFVT